MKNALRKIDVIHRIEAIRSIAVITILVITVLAFTTCESLGSSGTSGSSAHGTTTASTTPSPEPEPAAKPGGLILTGFDEYNGMYIQAERYPVVAYSPLVYTDEGRRLRAGALITNGSAALNVIKMELDEEERMQFNPYTESSMMELSLTISSDEFADYNWTPPYTAFVQFENGIAVSIQIRKNNSR